MSRPERDVFDGIVGRIPVPERERMAESAERVAGMLELRQRAEALHGRPLFADEHPEALQESVDATMRLSDGASWSLPAGWARIVNALHRDLVELLGDYAIAEIGQKSGGLRISASPIARDEAHERIVAARAESMRTCEVCGEPGTVDRPPRFSTRCPLHPVGRSDRIPGAIARPPGWASDEEDA